MKVVTAVFLALVAFSSALPSNIDTKDVRFIGDVIASVLESISLQIKERGFDPWIEEGTTYNMGLPVPVLFDLKAHVSNIAVAGVSNIVINRMDFGLITTRLDMDVSLPRIAISIGDAGLDATILGSKFDVSANANLAILEPRIAGRVQFNVGIITGVFVREVNLGFSLGGVEFDGDVKILGIDFSKDIKEFATVMIPNRLKELENEVNELVDIIAWEIFDRFL